MQMPPLQAWVNVVTGILIGPVNVVFAGVAQST
jgi:predicted membrane protein